MLGENCLQLACAQSLELAVAVDDIKEWIDLQEDEQTNKELIKLQKIILKEEDADEPSQEKKLTLREL